MWQNWLNGVGNGFVFGLFHRGRKWGRKKPFNFINDHFAHYVGKPYSERSFFVCDDFVGIWSLVLQCRLFRRVLNIVAVTVLDQSLVKDKSDEFLRNTSLR